MKLIKKDKRPDYTEFCLNLLAKYQTPVCLPLPGHWDGPEPALHACLPCGCAVELLRD